MCEVISKQGQVASRAKIRPAVASQHQNGGESNQPTALTQRMAPQPTMLTLALSATFVATAHSDGVHSIGDDARASGTTVRRRHLSDDAHHAGKTFQRQNSQNARTDSRRRRLSDEVYGMRDLPIAGDEIYYLDNRPCKLWETLMISDDVRHNIHDKCPEWIAQGGVDDDSTHSDDSGRQIQIPATVPGDLISDLVEAKLLEEPYYEINFRRNTSLWSGRVWNYTTTFSLEDAKDDDDKPFDAKVEEVLLVFDGIKMGANIYVNGVQLGTATDQFLRYSFPLVASRALLDYGAIASMVHTLTVSFDPAITTDGRFMACSGGWDWAPFPGAPVTADTGAKTYSRGIWKSVYLVIVPKESAAIKAVVPEIYYRGNYPTEGLVDGQHAGFDVQVRAHLWAPSAVRGYIEVLGSWGALNRSNVIEFEGDFDTIVSISADATDVKLWWPAEVGMGETIVSKRAQYIVNATFVSINPSVRVVTTSRQIGFRHVALVTGNDTDPAYVHNSIGKEGTRFHGMYLRVNGVALWMRGANVIPMDVLEGRLSATGHRQLVRSALIGRMNMLRVWGGGMVLPRAFYEEADALGLLLYHDMMYAQGGHDPKVTEVQEKELRHSVRKLSYHTSIVIWDGCNECQVEMSGSTAIYAKFVLKIVAEEDKSRPIWPSSPASGWKSGVDRLTCRPTGNHLSTYTRKEIERTIEVHGNYIHGTGFPAVNGADELQPVPPLIPLKLSIDEGNTGLGNPSIFASEFGCIAWSSFESMAPTVDSHHWGLHGGAPPDTCTDGFNRNCKGGNVMAQRNYPCDSIIASYFEVSGNYFEATGKDAFRRQLYHCMIGQALQMKGTIETRRSKNEMGHLLWQLNEIWPTGGWGSLEYSAPSGVDAHQGQILGGRWKPLHYLFRAGLFADVIATCSGESGICYIRNDGPQHLQCTLVISSFSIETGERALFLKKSIELHPGPGTLLTFSLDSVPCHSETHRGSPIDGRTHYLSLDIIRVDNNTDDGAELISHNDLLLAPPKDIIALPRSSGLEITVGGLITSDGEGNVAVEIEVTAKVPVVIYAVLTTEAPGRFSENVFFMRPAVGGDNAQPRKVLFYPFGAYLDLELLRSTVRIEDLAMYQSPAAPSELGSTTYA